MKHFIAFGLTVGGSVTAKLGGFTAEEHNAHDVAERMWPSHRVAVAETGTDIAHKLDLQAIANELRTEGRG